MDGASGGRMRSATNSPPPEQKDPPVHHRNVPLSVEGRRRLIARCQTRPIAHVAAEMGISRQCASKWVNRYRRHGEAGLLDLPSAPHHQPTATPAEVVARIEQLRRTRKYSARRIATELAAEGITISVRTVGRHLLHLGLNRRRFLDPTGATNRAPRRIVARWPGHMVHLDMKKTGQIPDGGGWRIHGKGSDQDRNVVRTKTRGQRARYTYLHSAIDGFSRLAYTEALPDEKARTAIGFVHRRGRSSPATASPTSTASSPTTAPATARTTSPPSCAAPATSGSRPTPHATTARSSATTRSWPKNSSTPAPGPAKPTAPQP